MCRALMIEDNQLFLTAFKTEILHRFPLVSFHEARDAREALEKISLLPPSCIFMDICLPGVNGLQLTEKVKKDFPGIRIAMLTSYDLPEYRRAASQCGADRFFAKDSLDWKEIEEFLQCLPEGKPMEGKHFQERAGLGPEPVAAGKAGKRP